MKKRCLAGLLGVVVAASFSFAEVMPDINAGSKAVLFTFSGLDNLGAGSYQGGIGGKFYLVDPIALRGSLAFGTASQKLPTTAASGGTDGKVSGLLFGLSLGAEYHLTFNRVSPFFGGLINYVTISTKRVAPINVANAPKVTTTNGPAAEIGYGPGKAFSFGGLGGVEFFLTKELSLSAEYQLAWQLPVGYETKVKTESNPVVEQTTKVLGTSRIGISNSGTLTLAVYF